MSIVIQWAVACPAFAPEPGIVVVVRWRRLFRQTASRARRSLVSIRVAVPSCGASGKAASVSSMLLSAGFWFVKTVAPSGLFTRIRPANSLPPPLRPL